MADELDEIDTLVLPEGKEPGAANGTMADRWGKEVVKLGFTYVPSVLLRGQERLGIDAIELVLLVHLLDHWWTNSSMPFPSKRRLAERLQVSEKTVQRAMARLEASGLVRRVARHYVSGGQASNFYDLSPLIEQVKIIAKSMAEARDAAKAEVRKAERPGHRSRKRTPPAPTDGAK